MPPPEWPSGERVVRELSAAGIVLVLPSAESEGAMIDPGNPWVGWIREAAQAEGELKVEGRWWSVLEPEGTGSPAPCRLRHLPDPDLRIWPPTLPFIASQSRKGGA